MSLDIWTNMTWSFGGGIQPQVEILVLCYFVMSSNWRLIKRVDRNTSFCFIQLVSIWSIKAENMWQRWFCLTLHRLPSCPWSPRTCDIWDSVIVLSLQVCVFVRDVFSAAITLSNLLVLWWYWLCHCSNRRRKKMVSGWWDRVGGGGLMYIRCCLPPA